MNSIRLIGHVDANRRLSAEVPDSIPPGPVVLLVISAAEEDEAGDAWTTGVMHEWADDLADNSQDIYTMADGEPVREL